MLLLLVMGMLVVLVVPMVLEELVELVVFLGEIFENFISPNFVCDKFIESKKKILGAKKNQKIPKKSSLL